ncbi:hypothetical protein B0H14DRAFT_3471443 [Mycena olivaceomarginata]|nr:hypothetical protein B0H14DRAFT_3471443 [Mycena olivaceomarginata]
MEAPPPAPPPRSPLRRPPQSVSTSPSTLSKRQHALHELMSSERAYASDLTLILEVHIPLADGPMTADDVKIALERTIGSALEDPDATDDHIDELFLRYAPELEGPYKQYITRHPSALAHLTALPQTSEVTAYHQKTRDLAVSLSHAWDLQSLLIKPVQRLLNIDATALTHPDRPHLVNARTAMEDVARQVNEGRRRAEVVKEVLTAPKKPPPFCASSPYAPPSATPTPTPRAQTAWPPNSPVFAQQLARTAQQWARAADAAALALLAWAHSFSAAIGLSSASRTASSPSPRLLANMAEHAPLHHHLLTMPLSAKNRPPPALLSASAHYLALRTQLAAELPAYLVLLHRGLSALVRRLAGLQAGFFGEARDAWAGLWDMLRVEGERNGGGEWRARWGDVDNGVAGLRICRPLRRSSTLGPAAAQLTPAEAVARAYSEPAPINSESSSSPSSLAYANGGPPSPHYERNSRDWEYNQRGEYSVHTNTSSTSSGKAAHVSNVPAALDPGLGSRRAPVHSNSMSSGYTSTSGGYGAASSSYATSMASGSPPPPTISGPFSLGSITGKLKGASDGYSGTGASSSYAPSAYSYSPGAGAAPYSPSGGRAGFAGWNENGSTGRGKSPARGASANGSSAASWALIAEPKISQDITWTAGKKDIRAKYGNNEVVVAFEPLTVSLLRGGKPQVVLNGRGLLHMEHFRNKKVEETKTEEAAPAPGEGAEDAAEQVVFQAGAEPEDDWEERFSTWTDSKPKGPESLPIDISFPSHGTIYGIPQHATRLALPTTAGDSPTFTDPYRLYNADVFEYLASSPMSLYGSIPVLHAHSADSTVGIFHAVGSETWIDVSHASDKSTETHWISESGILDLFLGRDWSGFSMGQRRGSTYNLIVDDRGRDQSAFSMGQRHGGTYSLMVDDGGRDRSAFSVGQRRGGTYSLIIDDGGRDRSAFSVGQRRGGTYILIIDNGGRDQSAFNVGQRRGGTYKLIVDDGGRDRSAFSVGQRRGGTYILIVDNGGRDRSAFNVGQRRGGTYKLIIDDGGRDRSAFSVGQRRGGTYKLIIDDGGRDRSAFSVGQQRGGTYKLIVDDGGRDRSAFSVGQRRGGTYILIVDNGGRDRSAFSVGQRRGGTYSLIVDDGERDRSAFSVGQRQGGTYILIVDDRGRDRSAFSVGQRRGGTYSLIVDDGERDRSAFSREGSISVQRGPVMRRHLQPDRRQRREGSVSVGQRCGGTYSLIVDDGERDRSAFSVGQRRGGTYILIVDNGGRDRSVFSVGQRCGGTYSLIVDNGGQLIWSG